LLGLFFKPENGGAENWIFIGLHGGIWQKTELFIAIVVRAS
jgi:hypothetical protein